MPAAFQIKGSLFTLSVLQILSNDLDEIEKQIQFPYFLIFQDTLYLLAF